MAILGVMFLFALKGAPLISSMRAFVMGRQIYQYQSAVLHYQADYQALPGDDEAAPERWGRPPSLFHTTNGNVSFMSDGKIDGLLSDPLNATGEQYLAWQDLRLGGYVDGDVKLVGQSAQPETRTGVIFGFAEDNLGLQQVLCLSKVPGRDAELLDKQLDDGNPATGRLRGTSKWDPIGAHNHFSEPDSAPYDPDKTYIICLPYLP